MEAEIVRVAGIALVGVVVSAILREIRPEFVIYAVMATVAVIFFFTLNQLQVIFKFLQAVSGETTYGKAFFPILLKVLAVSYLTDFTAQLCRDAGEGAIGTKLELAGKVVIFYLSIPVLTAILELIDEIL